MLCAESVRAACGFSTFVVKRVRLVLERTQPVVQ